MTKRKRPSVLLDTSILRQANGLRSGDGQRLLALSQGQIVHILIPEVAVREYESQELETVNKELHRLKQTANLILRRDIPDSFARPCREFRDAMAIDAKALACGLAGRFTAWLEERHVTVTKVTLKQSDGALLSYFSGRAPYKEVRKRADIPDAFIYESALESLSSLDQLDVVVHDRNLRDCLSEVDGIRAFEDIGSLLEDEAYQRLLTESNLGIADVNVANAIRDLEENHRLGKLSALLPQVDDYLSWSTYSDNTIDGLLGDASFEIERVEDLTLPKTNPYSVSPLPNRRFAYSTAAVVTARTHFEYFSNLVPPFWKKMSVFNTTERTRVTSPLLDGRSISPVYRYQGICSVRFLASMELFIEYPSDQLDLGNGSGAQVSLSNVRLLTIQAINNVELPTVTRPAE